MKTPLQNNDDIPPTCDDIENYTDNESDSNSKITQGEEGCENVHTWLDRLSARGTLCPDHVLKYIDWGPLQLSPEESIVARFLAKMSCGMGTSTNMVEGMLDFMHKTNPNCTMPKSVDKCWDCIKLAVEGHDGNVKLYFGRCLAFFCDIKRDHYVALRWFETCNGDNNVLDPIVQMPQLQLACSTKLSSYGVMPVSAILNGALLIPSTNKFYAVQSPREQRVYVKLNS
jgi:hypothetical protein